ncbi:hypothetical protein Daus18300_003832 [Diaporthe australafricana]|uniref:Uncharacterized protein n=1 Tax=Diaporthe australafricana TaxID=127596 RepID=A0ABR3XEA3_9PEZI
MLIPLEPFINRQQISSHVPFQTLWVQSNSIQNGLILPAAAELDELSAAVPVPLEATVLVDVPPEVIPLAVELRPPSPVPVADAVELPRLPLDELDDELDVSVVQLAVKKT